MNLERRKQSSFQRPSRSLDLKKTVLIVTEGEKTEPNYFSGFRLSSVTIKGTGHNTLGVVKTAEIEVKDASGIGKKYDEVWCVFDRDEHPLDQFNEALEFARRKGFKVAYSNESFELWLLLHYEYMQSQLHRRDYCTKLSVHFGERYEKNRKSIYKDLEPLMQTALSNAEKLRQLHDGKGEAESNPYTEVDILVRELIKMQS